LCAIGGISLASTISATNCGGVGMHVLHGELRLGALEFQLDHRLLRADVQREIDFVKRESEQIRLQFNARVELEREPPAIAIQEYARVFLKTSLQQPAALSMLESNASRD
jgi:hypothetical protein